MEMPPSQVALLDLMFIAWVKCDFWESLKYVWVIYP
jgi:hypothetical protein